jgi:hypothetical protein
VQKLDQKYLENSEMWHRRRMEKIIRTSLVKNEVLHKVKEERNILCTIKRRNADWARLILRRSCLLKHFSEGKIEGRIEAIGRQERRRKQLLDDLTVTRGYWKLKEEALDPTKWRNRFRSVYGHVVRQDYRING